MGRRQLNKNVIFLQKADEFNTVSLFSFCLSPAKSRKTLIFHHFLSEGCA